MTSALTWLNDLAQWLGRWVPRLTLVPPTHRAVRFGPRGGARTKGPGLVLTWPMVHELVLVPTTTLSYQGNGQVLPFKDTRDVVPRCMVCGTAVQFRVTDPVKAVTQALNFHALVDNRVQAAIARHVQQDLSDRAWLETARAEAAAALAPYGICVERLDLAQQGIGCVLKNVSDWSYSDGVDGKRPS
jgi:regulator of protease activity HflC (stomatin/prohibitin superfamily)